MEAVHYPNKPNTYDSLWVPRLTFHSGQVDMHDIAFGTDVGDQHLLLLPVPGERQLQFRSPMATPVYFGSGFRRALPSERPCERNHSRQTSPVMYGGELYLLLSATGEIIKVNIPGKTYEVIKQFDGFCCGMDVYGDYMFIGMSRSFLTEYSSAKLFSPFAWRGLAFCVAFISMATS